MIDSHTKLPAASMYGQRPLGSSASLRSNSTPGMTGVSDDECTRQRFNMLSNDAFIVMSNVPNSHSRLEAHQRTKLL